MSLATDTSKEKKTLGRLAEIAANAQRKLTQEAGSAEDLHAPPSPPPAGPPVEAPAHVPARPPGPKVAHAGPETQDILIYLKVLKTVKNGSEISAKAMAVVVDLFYDHFKKVASEAALVARLNKRATISAREIATAVRLVFPGELAKHAMAEGEKAMRKYAEAS
ncbi:histone-fold-containing protein [Mycena epipterygia]|nr:histone-fold-containing protein [Mycena epipterygia]